MNVKLNSDEPAERALEALGNILLLTEAALLRDGPTIRRPGIELIHDQVRQGLNLPDSYRPGDAFSDEPVED